MPGSQPVRYIDAITERYTRLGYAPYRWYVADDGPPPWAPPPVLAGARLGVLTTAGAYLHGQVAFHYRDDTSIRAIPTDTPDEALRFAHLTENYLVDARRDPGCVLPLAALRELVARGVVGSLAADAVSCMGGVYSQRRVREELVPAVRAAFETEPIDAALLIPM